MIFPEGPQKWNSSPLIAFRPIYVGAVQYDFYTSHVLVCSDTDIDGIQETDKYYSR